MRDKSNTPKSSISPRQVVPQGELLHLAVDDIIPSKINPRHLFDEPDLAALKANIKEHGVLVPITVYQLKAQLRYSILDGERRFRCCRELQEEGITYKIPANIVAAPSKIAGLLYMFSIHNFRQQWELMPTALALRTVMESLGETDDATLTKLTGLSEPQVKRCKILLSFEPKYQEMSLDIDAKKRIPSNFWIELSPVLHLCISAVPALARLGREGIIDRLVDKYRAKRIKSVLHFRRIMEAHEVYEPKNDVLQQLEQYVFGVDVETRQAFDRFIVNDRRARAAIEACDTLIQNLDHARLDYTLDREDLKRSLNKVREYITRLLTKLEGEDEPEQLKLEQ